MKKLFSVLKYTKNYRGYTFLNILFNILFALFAAATLALIAPFIELLFKNNDEELRRILLQGPPDFSPASGSSNFQMLINYYLANLIIHQGKIQALIVICLAVFIITL